MDLIFGFLTQIYPRSLRGATLLSQPLHHLIWGWRLCSIPWSGTSAHWWCYTCACMRTLMQLPRKTLKLRCGVYFRSYTINYTNVHWSWAYVILVITCVGCNTKIQQVVRSKIEHMYRKGLWQPSGNLIIPICHDIWNDPVGNF